MLPQLSPHALAAFGRSTRTGRKAVEVPKHPGSQCQYLKVMYNKHVSHYIQAYLQCLCSQGKWTWARLCIGSAWSGWEVGWWLGADARYEWWCQSEEPSVALCARAKEVTGMSGEREAGSTSAGDSHLSCDARPASHLPHQRDAVIWKNMSNINVCLYWSRADFLYF